MQIGVYGSGYLGTVISACLADFGTPVSCCHPDRTRMVEMAQGNEMCIRDSFSTPQW